MEHLGFASVALVLLIYALLSARAQRGVLTPPMVFVLFGYAAHEIGLLDLAPEGEVVHLLAEITLVLVLFVDAARINLRRLFREHSLPVRMLLIGMPLTIALGTAVAWGVFPELGIAGAALLASILAPTDAALGQETVTSPDLPVRIRQTLNVESGLNDGIALPFVLLFLSLASTVYGRESEAPWLVFGLSQITVGPLVGAAVGLAGGKLMALACKRGWMTESFQGLAVIGFAILAFSAAELVNGNGFMAAFVGGLAFGHTAERVDRFLLEFGEAEGQLLILGLFLIFGAALVPVTIEHFDWRMALFALFALTLMRMIPVWLSLIGSGLHRTTFWFLGWFGPRGLASIVFALLVAADPGLPHAHLILDITVVTVSLSVFAHGLSAMPLSRLYAGTCAAREDAFTEERKSVAAMLTRPRGFSPVDRPENPG